MTLFDGPAPRLFALPPGADFAEAFAQGLRARAKGAPPEALARAEVMLNTEAGDGPSGIFQNQDGNLWVALYSSRAGSWLMSSSHSRGRRWSISSSVRSGAGWTGCGRGRRGTAGPPPGPRLCPTAP